MIQLQCSPSGKARGSCPLGLDPRRSGVRRPLGLGVQAALVVLVLGSAVARAQTCELPIMVSSAAKPNVLLAHDTSGSMKQDFADPTTAYAFNNGFATVQTYEARYGGSNPDYKGLLEASLATLVESTSPLKTHLHTLMGTVNTGFTDVAIYDFAENKICNDYKSAPCSANLTWAAKCNLGAMQNATDGPAQCQDLPGTGTTNEGEVPKYNHVGSPGVGSPDPNPSHCYDYGKGVAFPTMTSALGRAVESGNPCNLIPTIDNATYAGNTSGMTNLFQGRYLNYQHLARTRDDQMRQGLRDAVAATQNDLNWGLMTFVNSEDGSHPGNAALGGKLVSAITGTNSVTNATSVMTALTTYGAAIGWNATLTSAPPLFSSTTGDVVNDATGTWLADLLRDSWKYFQGTFHNPGTTTNFASPIAYACQPNFVILATDGRPNTDMAEASEVSWGIGTDFITTYCTGDYSDSTIFGHADDFLAINDFATCVHRELDASTAFSGRQALNVYTIGFVDDISSVDQLLQEAATGGGGDAYTATNAAQFVTAISSAAQSIIAKSSSSTSVAVVSTSGAATDLLVTASFVSDSWQGQLVGHALPLVAGATPLWKAGDLLLARAPSTRRIYTALDTADADTRIDDRIDFSVTNEATLRSYLGAANSTEGAALINWVRGTDAAPYRTRNPASGVNVWKLGDVIDSSPVVVGAPPFFYPQASYQTFYTNNQNRPLVIYVASNDGMLHAFDSVTGSERWGFIPNWNLPLFKSTLSSATYCHYFAFDGSPRVVDAYFSEDGAAAAWHTILIVGGGKHGGYVALDVTDPGSEAAPNPPVVLWQWPNPTSFAAPAALAEARLGSATARPAIHFLAASGATFPTTTSSWVATIASGTGNSDGQGYLFNVALDTGVASPTVINVDPAVEAGNGLTDPVAVDLNADQATDRVYVGDRLGRVWRWDVAQTTNPTQLVYNAGSTRPIMARPVLSFASALAGDPNVLIYFGTGKLETVSDESDLSVQRIYALKDTGARNGTPSTPLLTDANLVNATGLTTGSPVVSFAGSGWFIDLKLGANGEAGSANAPKGARALYPGVITNGVFFITVFTPDTSDPCNFGGLPTLFAMNGATGGPLASPVLDINGDGTVDSTDVRAGQPVRTLNLGAGAPSQPIMDAERHTLIVQSSDTQLHPVAILTGGSPVTMTRWKILGR